MLFDREVISVLDLPVTTEFNKRIPKQKFYDNMSVTPELKQAFSKQIAVIYWKNKVAASTTNLAPGKRVTELEVFELRLNQPVLDTGILPLMDREIPYHILFLLTYQGKVQAWIGYKEPSAANQNVFKVSKYYHTDWLEPEKLSLRMDGMDLDAVYDNFIRQIAPEEIGEWSTVNGVRDAIERYDRVQKLQKQIAALEAKVRNERQFNRQVELNAELKRLRAEMERLS